MTRSQRLVFKSLEGREFRRELGVPTYVGSSDTSLTLTQLHVFQITEGRGFRLESGVPTVGSPGILREFRGLTTSL